MKSGYNKRSGQSGFHLGTGSALTTAAIFKSKPGDIYLDFQSRTATGFDGVVVDETRWGDTISLITRRLPDPEDLKVLSEQDEFIGKKVIMDRNKSVVTVLSSKNKNSGIR